MVVDRSIAGKLRGIYDSTRSGARVSLWPGAHPDRCGYADVIPYGVLWGMNGLDLFSGIGGLSFALAPWVKPVAYCENDRYAISVILSRMAMGALEIAPIWDDVRTFRADNLPSIDIIYGGFPCQDISVAGNGKGLAGEQSGLVFEIFRLCGEIKPTFVFLENVPAIRTRGGERVVKELAEIGYDCRWDCLSAYDVGAPQLRDRWFLLAKRSISDTDGEVIRDRREWDPNWYAKTGDFIEYDGSACWRRTEPTFCGVVDGLSNTMDRLRGLGNAVVPAQSREAFKRLMGL